MSPFFLVAGLLGGMLLGQSGAETAPDVATVEILASTTFGDALPKVLVILKPVGPIGEYKQIGRTIKFGKIPYGLYEVELQAAGFSTLRERIGVYQPSVQLWFGLAVSPLHSEARPEIAGSIKPPQHIPETLWVRLVPRYSGEFIEDKVTQAGTFHLVGMKTGQYFLMLFNKTELLSTKAIDFNGGNITTVIEVTR